MCLVPNWYSQECKSPISNGVYGFAMTYILYDYTKYKMIKQISVVMVVVIGLLSIPLTTAEASTHHFESHLHGTSGSTHHHGFIAGSFFKFHQHKQNPQQ